MDGRKTIKIYQKDCLVLWCQNYDPLRKKCALHEVLLQIEPDKYCNGSDYTSVEYTIKIKGTKQVKTLNKIAMFT